VFDQTGFQPGQLRMRTGIGLWRISFQALNSGFLNCSAGESQPRFTTEHFIEHPPSASCCPALFGFRWHKACRSLLGLLQAATLIHVSCYEVHFSARVEIRFQTRGRCVANATVYYPTGRLVRELLQGVLGAGDHDVVWDGRDMGHGAIAAGANWFTGFRTLPGATIAAIERLHSAERDGDHAERSSCGGGLRYATAVDVSVQSGR
jgi:hypothetical protein